MAKSHWQASLRAPDGTEMSEIFEGERNNSSAWNSASAWLMNKALPRMKTTEEGLSNTTEYAHGRFQDALLSQTGDIVVWCDPWEMRLEHYTAQVIEELEAARRVLPTQAGKPFQAGFAKLFPGQW